MSEIERKKIDYIQEVVNGKYQNTANWAFIFMLGNTIEYSRKGEKYEREEQHV